MMPMDADELACIAEGWEQLMPNTCDILRMRADIDDDDYDTVNTNVPCSFYPASSISSLGADVEQNLTPKVLGDWVINLPLTETIEISDRIHIVETQQLFEVVTHNQSASFSGQITVKATLVE